MRTKFIYIISSVFLFLVNNPIIAQRDGGSRGVSDPGPDPDAVPINDNIWILLVVALVYAIIKLKVFTKNNKYLVNQI